MLPLRDAPAGAAGAATVTPCPNHPDPATAPPATVRFGAREYCAPCVLWLQAPLRPVLVSRPVPIRAIVKATAAHFGVKACRLILHDRTPYLTAPRAIAQYLARHLNRASYPDIGRHFNRDHTSVVNLVGKVESDAELLAIASAIGAQLQRVAA